MTEIVGSRNPVFSVFEKTDIYHDIGNYKEMNQLELSKKLPKWESLLSKLSIKHYNWAARDHFLNHCLECSASLKSLESKDYALFRVKIHEFMTSYVPLATSLCSQAKTFYLEKKEEVDQALKIKMAQHQKTEVTCKCGGKYSLRNKQKHFKTKKHLSFSE